MGLKFERKKKRRWWLSLAYRFHHWAGSPGRLRLAFYLNAHWVFGRFAHEEAHRVLGEDAHPVLSGGRRFLARHLPSHAAVLDLGCGSGRLSFWLAEHCATVVGVDHNPASIGIAKTRVQPSNVEFILGDAVEVLSSSDQRFDVLILYHVLEHLDSPGDFLTQISPKFTHVYVEVPDFEASAHNRVRQELKLDLSYSDADHVSEFGREELLALVSAAGLNVVDSERIYGVQRLWCEAVHGEP